MPPTFDANRQNSYITLVIVVWLESLGCLLSLVKLLADRTHWPSITVPAEEAGVC
jgi:hypothetical protein